MNEPLRALTLDQHDPGRAEDLEVVVPEPPPRVGLRAVRSWTLVGMCNLVEYVSDTKRRKG